MKTVKWDVLAGWKDQVLKGCMDWANGCLGKSERLQDYEAGLNEGFRQAISVLKLHGYIEVDYKK